MAKEFDFMERWGLQQGSQSNGMQTRSAKNPSTTARTTSTPASQRKTTTPSSSPLKRKHQAQTTTPSKARKPNQQTTLTTTSTPSQASSPAAIFARLLSQNKQYQATNSTDPATPFEELLSTVIISRPIQRTLGHRAIRTLLSEPYSLRTPRAVLSAGERGVFAALEEARTLHKDKTAAQVVGLARTVVQKLEDDDDEGGGDKAERTGLEKLRRDARGDGERLRRILMRDVKGLGETGTMIFRRRIQRMWGEFCPFVDERTASALQGLGLPSDARELKELLDEEWSKLDVSGVADEEEDEEARKRLVFVEILKGAVGTEADKKNKK